MERLKSGTMLKKTQTENRKISVLRHGLESIPSAGPEDYKHDVLNMHPLERNVRHKKRCISLQHRKKSGEMISKHIAKRRCSEMVKPSFGIAEDQLQRVRSFKLTPRGFINNGDCFREKTNPVRRVTIREITEYKNKTDVDEVSIDNITTETNRGRTEQVEVCGYENVGKTTLIDQMMTSDYLACRELSTDFNMSEKSISVNLNGDDMEISFTEKKWNKKVDASVESTACVVVFSVNDVRSFLFAKEKVVSIRKKSSFLLPIILVANKIDIVRSRAIAKDDACRFAKKYDCKYVETSVLLHYRVDELLVGIVGQIQKFNKEITASELAEKRLLRSERNTNSKTLFSLITKIFRKKSRNTCEELW